MSCCCCSHRFGNDVKTVDHNEIADSCFMTRSGSIPSLYSNKWIGKSMGSPILSLAVVLGAAVSMAITVFSNTTRAASGLLMKPQALQWGFSSLQQLFCQYRLENLCIGICCPTEDRLQQNRTLLPFPSHPGSAL